jgi:hypothetical protein
MRHLAEPGLLVGPPLNSPPPEIGLIAGVRPDILRKWLLKGDHDGLVTAESALGIDAAGTMTIPCSHHQLHWRKDTAEAVALFLQTGKFQS